MLAVTPTVTAWLAGAHASADAREQAKASASRGLTASKVPAVGQPRHSGVGARSHTGPIPTVFSTKDELTREQALGADIRSYPRPSLLAEPLTAKGKTAKGLAALGIETHGDLLEHLPHTHQDRRDARTIATVGVGEEATIAVTVRAVSVKPMRDRRRKRVEARVFDETGPAVAVWFNQPWVATQMGEGSQVLLHGKMRNRNQFWVSAHELVGQGAAPVHTVGLVPVHPATYGISPDTLRKLAWEDYPLFRHVVEPLPAALRVAEGLADRSGALAAAHFPDTEDEAAQARHRLAFEELFLLQLAVAGRRRAHGGARRAAELEPSGELVDAWIGSLPFELTGDQRKAMAAIDADLAKGAPMQRLLMGEVGSGKTVIALAAMLRAAENGRQAALMAPTETLAEQHLITIDRLLGGMVPVELLTGSTPAARRRDLLARLGSGELSLVVGTHALIEETVEFKDLALCVVDEQHRFGVRQRAALDAKAPEGLTPHALHMTATPIPRTLALTAYGDLEATVLRELPAGRRPGRYPRGRRRPGAGAGIRAHSRGDREGAPVLRRVPAGAGVRGAPGQGGDRGGGAPAGDGVPRPACRAHPRADEDRREAGGHALLRGGRGRRAGGHERDRGGHRRAQRHRHGHRGGGSLRPVPAPPAPWPRGAGGAPVALHPLRRSEAAAAGGDRLGARRLQAGRGGSGAARGGGGAREPASRGCPSFASHAFPTTRSCWSGPAPGRTS